MQQIAALYVDAKRGPYPQIEGVDCWDEARDARLYAGPWPVVAHPPCARWCRLAKQMEAMHGLKVGDDGGCFGAALQAVRTHGGVLEHPAHSLAWAAFDLPRPQRGVWLRGIEGGWACEIDQVHYGHLMNKPTWLYTFGATSLPSIPTHKKRGTHVMGRPSQRRKSMDQRPAISEPLIHLTPRPFADLLVEIARSARA